MRGCPDTPNVHVGLFYNRRQSIECFFQLFTSR